MALFLLDPVEDLLRADPRAGAGGLWHCLWSRSRPTVGQSHPSGVLRGSGLAALRMPR